MSNENEEIRTYDEYRNLKFILSPMHRWLHEDESMSSQDAYDELLLRKDVSILKATEDIEENADYDED